MPEDGKVDTQMEYVLGTAGHIDHGKSALVEALTGTDPDRLAEEKERGITIELGFAQLELPDGKRLSIVDVPGHERFVRQMIAGSSGIDGVLLCIAADDGIMPQTEEHLAVLELLDIDDCIVAITKSDLVDDEWIELIEQEVADRLAGTRYGNAPVISVSVRDGEGLDELTRAIGDMVERRRSKRSSDAVRMPIDRVFTLKGVGTVVTGTLWTGEIHLDDSLEILPEGIIARARSLQVHNAPVETALPGRRVAIDLQGVSANDIGPGDFIATPGSLDPTDRFDGYLKYMGFERWEKPLASGVEVHVSHGTREVIGRLLLFDGKEEISVGEEAFVQIRLNEPLPLSKGDHFIVRSFSPVYVIGGGTVIDPHPRRRSMLKEGEEELLEALHEDDDELAVRSLFRIARAPMSLEEIEGATGMKEPQLAEVVSTLVDEGHLKELGAPDSKGASTSAASGRSPIFGTPADIQRLLSKMNNILVAFHAEDPEAQGMSKEALGQRMDKALAPQVIDGLLDVAGSDGVVDVHNGIVSHRKAGRGSKEKLERTEERILEILREGGEKPPLADALIDELGADSSQAPLALRELEAKGSIVKVSKDLYLEKGAFDGMVERLTERLQEGPATVSELRQALDSTRKYMIPLMEYCDSHGITRRNGDMRELVRR